MAIIGRVTCPWCGFASAHVKQNDGKLPFVHCPEDGILTQARNTHQAALLLAKMRPLNGGSGDGPTPPAADDSIIVPPRPPAPPAAPVADPPPAPKKAAGLFEQLLGKSK